MSEFKIGEEVQFRDNQSDRSSQWLVGVYCGKSRQRETTYLHMDGETFGWLNIELRRKPKTVKRMMQWAMSCMDGQFYALSVDEVKKRPFDKTIGEPFEQTFEVDQ
jgi:hypothetical protein